MLDYVLMDSPADANAAVSANGYRLPAKIEWMWAAVWAPRNTVALRV